MSNFDRRPSAGRMCMVDARPRDWHETHLAVNEIRVRTGWQDVVSDIDAVD